MQLCSSLACDRDVRQALGPIEELLAAGRGAEAMPPAVQTLCVVARRCVDAALRFNPVIPLAAKALGRAAAGRSAWVAREAMRHMAGNKVGEAYAQLLLAYACLELMAR